MMPVQNQYATFEFETREEALAAMQQLKTRWVYVQDMGLMTVLPKEGPSYKCYRVYCHSPSQHPAVAAIMFAVDTDDPRAFLQAWIEGDTSEWPDYKHE